MKRATVFGLSILLISGCNAHEPRPATHDDELRANIAASEAAKGRRLDGSDGYRGRAARTEASSPSPHLPGEQVPAALNPDATTAEAIAYLSDLAGCSSSEAERVLGDTWAGLKENGVHHWSEQRVALQLAGLLRESEVGMRTYEREHGKRHPMRDTPLLESLGEQLVELARAAGN